MRTVIVTGANRGIGLEISRQMAARGYRVLLTSRDAKQGQRAAALLNAEGHTGEIVPHPLNVTEAASVQQLYTFVKDQYGAPDALINNAAILIDDNENILQVSPERFQQTFETNVWGVLRLCQIFIPLMRQRKYGRIVNVSSEMGQWDSLDGGTPAYSLSKTTLNGLTVQLARSVAGSGVLINACCPGWVKTDMGGPHAHKTVAEGADTPVWLATLPADGPHGGFFQERQPLAW